MIGVIGAIKHAQFRGESGRGNALLAGTGRGELEDIRRMTTTSSTSSSGAVHHHQFQPDDHHFQPAAALIPPTPQIGSGLSCARGRGGRGRGGEGSGSLREGGHTTKTEEDGGRRASAGMDLLKSVSQSQICVWIMRGKGGRGKDRFEISNFLE
ncbi:hypothetical protein niasHT_023552 [Heterodera trifolii]|uniref:Uncharacterized protein n=1 Tax=Heterodera trifolii TaxID=157864 RepID=A0ABD2JEN2_9BILA